MHHNLPTQLEEYVSRYPYSFSIDRPQITSNPDLKPILNEAKKAWEQYAQTAEGKKMVESFSTKDLHEIRASLPEIIDHPIIKKLIDWLREKDFLAASFSIGLKLEAEALIGFTGIIGLAVGIGTANGKESVEYLTVALAEGIELGVMLGVQIGVWVVSPGELGGFSLCTEVDLGFDVELSEGTYYKVKEFLGETITVGVGVEDGISEMECYTFILGDQGDNPRDPYIKPVIQKPKKNFLIIEKVKCVHPSNDGAGNENEVYFIFKPDGGKEYHFPTYDYFSMKEGETWDTGRSVWFDDYIDITIYDEDGTSENDIVGTFHIPLSQLSVGQSKVFQSTKDYSSLMDNIEYTVQVRLIARDIDLGRFNQ